MKIGINCLHIIPGKLGGLETYMHNLLASILRMKHEPYEFFIFCSRKYSYAFAEYKESFRIIEIDIDVDKSYKRIFFEQLRFHKILRFYEIDILHSSGYTAPILMDIETVQTVHDLNYIEIPFIIIKSLGLLRWIIQRILSPICIRQSTFVLCVSESVKRSIEKYTGRKEGVITVPNVLNPGFVTPSPCAASDEFMSRLPQNYLLNIASFFRHKNHQNLFRAFAEIRSKLDFDMKLVLAGLKFYSDKDKFEFDRILEESGLGDNVVIVTDRLSIEELIVLYKRARVFVFPSTFEGFGFPIIEALGCGTSVACSSLDVFREIGGDAVAYFDPQDPYNMAECVLKLITDPEHRTELMQRSSEIFTSGRYTLNNYSSELKRVYGYLATTITRKRCGIIPERQSAE